MDKGRVEMGILKCINCGEELLEGAAFCTKCGHQVKETGSLKGPLRFEIKHRPSYSLLEVQLEKDQSVTAEAGALTYMSSNIEVRTRTRIKRSGIWGALKVSLLGGETFFVNDYLARDAPGKVGLVSAPIGDITRLKVEPKKGYIVQSSAYIASSEAVDLDTQWQGFTRGIFGQNLFMLKVSGFGDVFINTFGAIDMHLLSDGETLIVDNYHLAAFSDTCRYNVRMFGGLKSTILGGEGLVTDVSGPGEVYIQTKNPREFVDWIWRYLHPRVRAVKHR